MSEASAVRRWRVWALLFAAPFVLGLVFGVVIAWLVLARGTAAADLFRAIEPIAPLPTALAFGLVFLLTRLVARKDGLSLRDIGWSRPQPLDVAAGLTVGGIVCAANAWVLHPVIQRVNPSFDPTLAAVSLLPAAAMMIVAVVAEDTLYRGYALRTLRERHGLVFAVVVTSVFYALLTPGPDVALKVWALCFGAVLAAVRLWRGNLWPVALAHLTVSLAPKLLALAR